jgi:HAMP domain-containing protein
MRFARAPFGAGRAAALLAVWLTACSAQKPVQTPQSALDAYAQALAAGDVHGAYELLSDEAQNSMSFEAFERMVRENPEEVQEIARSLGRPSGDPLVTATVTTPDGESLLLIYEQGAWRVDGSAIDLYSQATPLQAVTSFIRAFENKRYDVLMRFVPEPMREGLDEKKLKSAWEGEQRAEIERLVQALDAALPTARVEMLGDRATMAYGAGGTVELVQERGVWKVEEFK